MVKLQLFLFMLLVYNLNLYATIYKQTDTHGNVIYSDSPLMGSAKIENLKNANVNVLTPTFPATAPITPIVQPKAASTVAPVTYTLFQLISPKNEETIANQPYLTVQVKVEPGLHPDHKIQVYVDNRPVGQAVNNTQITLGQIERGTHTLHAAIIDANQQIIKQTSTVTIYIQRISVNAPTRTS